MDIGGALKTCPSQVWCQFIPIVSHQSHRSWVVRPPPNYKSKSPCYTIFLPVFTLPHGICYLWTKLTSHISNPKRYHYWYHLPYIVTTYFLCLCRSISKFLMELPKILSLITIDLPKWATCPNGQAYLSIYPPLYPPWLHTYGPSHKCSKRCRESTTSICVTCNWHASTETCPTSLENMQISHSGSIASFNHQHRMDCLGLWC